MAVLHRAHPGSSPKETRLGIPVIYGIDGVHGANYTVGSTLFPHQLRLAATRNPALVRPPGDHRL